MESSIPPPVSVKTVPITPKAMEGDFSESSMPESKKRGRGRPPKGLGVGIAVDENTMSSDGSARAKKRRLKDRALSPTSASIQRAQTADRVRKSQKLKELRNSTSYQQAIPEDQLAMEDRTMQDLYEYRESRGQLAILKHPDELYDSMDDFLERNETEDEDTEDNTEEDESESLGFKTDEEVDEEGNGANFNSNDSVGGNAGDLVIESDGEIADDEQSLAEDSEDDASTDIDLAIEGMDDERTEEIEDSAAGAIEANEEDEEKALEKNREYDAVSRGIMSGNGGRKLVERRCNVWRARFARTNKEEDRLRMEDYRQVLDEYDKDPAGPNIDD